MVSTSKRPVAEHVEENGSQCRHYWLIEAAGGPISKGVCRLCGVERQFKNYLESTEWEREAPPPEPLHPIGLSLGSTRESEEEQQTLP